MPGHTEESGFQIGQGYPRESLLEFCGSRQTQTGIIWGDREPSCMMVTSGGMFKAKAGYEDELLPDGTFFYFGQGSKGDQDPNRFSNRMLIDGQRTVLLFQTREPTAAEARARGGSHAKVYTYSGQFEVGTWDFYRPDSGPRARDRLLRFHLVPTSAPWLEGGVIDPVELGGHDPRELRRLIVDAGTAPGRGQLNRAEYVRRSKLVRLYALLGANGTCALCSQVAPFLTSKGIPFLKVHHLHRLGDGGPDAPENVAALCPNCHRAVHHAADRKELAEQLEARVRVREANL